VGGGRGRLAKSGDFRIKTKHTHHQASGPVVKGKTNQTAICRISKETKNIQKKPVQMSHFEVE